MPVIEITSFEASEALLVNPSLFSMVLDIVSTAEGFISAYGGLQVEDKKTAYLSLTWESMECYKRAVANPRYPEMATKLSAAIVGNPDTLDYNFVEFRKDHTPSFDAPVTELCTMQLREGRKAEELEAVLEPMHNVIAAARFSGFHPPPTYGDFVGKSGLFLVTSGWDSAKDHPAARNNTTKPWVDKIHETVEVVSLVHVDFHKCT
ncbi:hypothetical protein DFP72DRAFT_587873 [Ephemerocybe angulata]|uniref:ABM domain-containing protein n=1 Tax=Ephemerocybe angulata TaxID=980116 RepID=A0A8H6HK37_9AGAR|nr:hypothetical protein DFP72DRAFT_587873 [Tulosesus angulatus]